MILEFVEITVHLWLQSCWNRGAGVILGDDAMTFGDAMISKVSSFWFWISKMLCSWEILEVLAMTLDF